MRGWGALFSFPTYNHLNYSSAGFSFQTWHFIPLYYCEQLQNLESEHWTETDVSHFQSFCWAEGIFTPENPHQSPNKVGLKAGLYVHVAALSSLRWVLPKRCDCVSWMATFILLLLIDTDSTNPESVPTSPLPNPPPSRKQAHHISILLHVCHIFPLQVLNGSFSFPSQPPCSFLFFTILISHFGSQSADGDPIHLCTHLYSRRGWNCLRLKLEVICRGICSQPEGCRSKFLSCWNNEIIWN